MTPLQRAIDAYITREPEYQRPVDLDTCHFRKAFAGLMADIETDARRMLLDAMADGRTVRAAASEIGEHVASVIWEWAGEWIEKREGEGE